MEDSPERLFKRNASAVPVNGYGSLFHHAVIMRGFVVISQRALVTF